MRWRLSSIRGLRINRVRTDAHLQVFAQIVAADWTPPDSEVLRFYKPATPALLTADAPQWLYVGYLWEFPSPHQNRRQAVVLSVRNICTLSAYRRQGFDTALTLQSLLDARMRGYRTAILQASNAGAGIYARVGFAPFGHYHRVQTILQINDMPIIAASKKDRVEAGDIS